VVDSGVSHHIVNDEKLLPNVKIYYGTVKVADGSDMQITGVSSFTGTSEVEGVCERVHLNELFVVPCLTKSLLSVKSMMKQGCKVCFNGNKVECLVAGKVIVVGKLYGILFKVILQMKECMFGVASNGMESHLRLRHA
jgi:hypothetical protein